MADGRPPEFNINGLPSEVAEELAAFLRSHTTKSHDKHYPALITGIESQSTAHKDVLQDIQSQISNIIEPTSNSLVPLARELKAAFDQIDQIEYLVNQIIVPQINDMNTKLTKTEQLVRREEKAINEGRRVEMWKGVDIGSAEERRIFTAADYFDEAGNVKELVPERGMYMTLPPGDKR